MRRWILVGVMILALVAGGAYAALGPLRVDVGVKDEASDEQASQLPVVQAPDTVIAEGEVVPIREADLSLPEGGIVAQVLVAEGDQVESGQLLVRLDSRRQAAAVARAEAEVQRAQAHLEELRAGPRPQDVEIAQAAVAMAEMKVAKLRADSARYEDIRMAEAELRQARAELELTRAGTRPEAIAVAEAELSVARAALREAQMALADTELRAPFAGTVAALEISPGEYVAPGTSVLKLADLSAWRVETRDLTEIQVAEVREGQPVTVKFDALPDLQIRGKVLRVEPLGENKQGDITYTVVIELDRQDPRLRWNMTTTVEIQTK